MPLLAMSPNIQEGAQSPSRKRNHEDYVGQELMGSENMLASENHEPSSGLDDVPSSPDSPLSDSPMSPLTDVGSSMFSRPSPSPNKTPSKGAERLPRVVISLNSAIPPPTPTSVVANAPTVKRRRLTPAEREEKAKADAARKQEREEKAKADAARKQEKEEQKAAAAEAKKRAQAEDRDKKQKLKEEKAEEKKAKEAKKREKDEEAKRLEEEKNKKAGKQLSLSSFFAKGALSAPKASSTARAKEMSPMKGSPTKATTAAVSEYERIFKPFFIKENVVMATSLYGLDEETKDAKSRIMDEYLSGGRGQFTPSQFSGLAAAADYFHLPVRQARGRKRPTVRKVMSMLAESDAGDTTNPQTKMALGLLKTIPMKFLGFREDVRPAYYGTATNIPPHARLAKIARNPLTKTELPLNYDYDSEAEWVDDGDGEDVDDLDDDEEEVEEDEEMADFLDDSEDAVPARAAFFLGGMEPESTGLCWENQQRQGPVAGMDTYRMEFLLDHDGPIDPLSPIYWETQMSEPTAPEVLKGANSKGAGAKGASLKGAGSKAASARVSKAATGIVPPPAPVDAFAALGGCCGAPAKADPKKAVVAAEFVSDFKKAIVQYSKLSKLGIVEILSSEFEKCTKSQIKNSLEAMAERTGAGQHKTWKLKDGVAS